MTLCLRCLSLYASSALHMKFTGWFMVLWKFSMVYFVCLLLFLCFILVNRKFRSSHRVSNTSQWEHIVIWHELRKKRWSVTTIPFSPCLTIRIDQHICVMWIVSERNRGKRQPPQSQGFSVESFGIHTRATKSNNVQIRYFCHKTLSHWDIKREFLLSYFFSSTNTQTPKSIIYTGKHT